jgi:hypothetical protein
MSKKKFRFDLLPLDHFLVGFSFQTGTVVENERIIIEEYTIGFGFLNIYFIRQFN